MTVVRENALLPTLVISLGGTGTEVLLRLRQWVAFTYGSLENFPIAGFLAIDTDPEALGIEPRIASNLINERAKSAEFRIDPLNGSPLTKTEQMWAGMSNRSIRNILANRERYPWLTPWFPDTPSQTIPDLERGTAQKRGWGRFAFLEHYTQIQQHFQAAYFQTQGHENWMLDRHQIQVASDALNVIVVASLAGGTGGGMLIDLAYCIRHWLPNVHQLTTTAFLILPQLVSQANCKIEHETEQNRLLANSYAALMELNYFSAENTEYVVQFSSEVADKIRSQQPPFDATYLIDPQQSAELNATLREQIAQFIALDLIPEVASSRQALRQTFAQNKSFSSFGLASIEIPIAALQRNLSNQLASDLVSWWLCEPMTTLPDRTGDITRRANQEIDGEMDTSQINRLKQLRFTAAELLADLLTLQERSILSLVADGFEQMRTEIAAQNWLQCTYQGTNFFGPEKGKILQFVESYLAPQVKYYYECYLTSDINQAATATSTAGEFLAALRDNRDRLIWQGKQTLEAELKAILDDSNQGISAAIALISNAEKFWLSKAETLRQEAETVYRRNQLNRWRQYQAATAGIEQFKSAYAGIKEAQMRLYSEDALTGAEACAIAFLQWQSRMLAIDVFLAWQTHFATRLSQLKQLQQRLRTLRNLYQQTAVEAALHADTLKINGTKLYRPTEPSLLYDRLILFQVRQAPIETPTNALTRLELNIVFNHLSQTVWQSFGNSHAAHWLDLAQRSSQPDDLLQTIILEKMSNIVKQMMQSLDFQNHFRVDTRLLSDCQQKAALIRRELRQAYQQAQPLIQLSLNDTTHSAIEPKLIRSNQIAVAQDEPALNQTQILLWLREQVGAENLLPMGSRNRHQILFIQEIGGFALRSIKGLKTLQHAYQSWIQQSEDNAQSQNPLSVLLHSFKNISQFQDIFSDAPEKVTVVQESPLLEEPAVEIDEAKRQKDVEGIVRSDFFQSIAAKAKTMRQKKQKGIGE